MTTQNTQDTHNLSQPHVGNVAMKSDAEIEHLIGETEDTLQVLMDELKRRQEDVQHKSIDNLDTHLANADTSFKALKDFIAMALAEIRGKS